MKRFAFINHPINTNELKMNYPAARCFPDFLLKQILKCSPPFKSPELTLRLDEIDCKGWSVTCPLTETQILGSSDKLVQKRIFKALRAAQKLGAEVIGLGGCIPAALGSKEIIMAERPEIKLTFGHNYSILAAVEGVKLAAITRGYDMDQVTAAVLGATGRTGSVCAAILAREVKNLILTGDNKVKLHQMTNNILYDTGLPVKTVTSAKRALNLADIVFVDVSSSGSEIRSEDFKKGAVVCFVKGAGISIRDLIILRSLQDIAMCGNDLKIIDGGLVEVPGVPGFASEQQLPSGMVYPWMAETLILTLEKNRSRTAVDDSTTMGKIDALKVKARSYGFRVAGYSEVAG
ncbi:hypothetical protein [Phosphitispora fastidiosa]|uniref:hypothetical protein n=1 Tax=Phosphitispora fastidiosa TaxID=2837202 RepID=UPI001E5AF855|nr:hypothetical protein [Phosphitispora fastidiosa]MBU7007844.1 putative amino acid dehydrogenase [Phosphitispora fastidiosa]